jgi:hypothetical protein
LQVCVRSKPRLDFLSRQFARYFAIGFGLLVFGIGIFLDILLVDVGTSRPVTLLLTNALTGAASGVALWLAARNEIRRRVEQSQRLIVLDEMNHHVRNALQAMVLQSYALDADTARELRSAVDRIQWSLTEILPRINFSDEKDDGD